MLKKQIPNLFTCANLVCGCVALVFAIQGKPISYIAYCVWLGAFFDFFDGFLARILKVSGDFGKQLDSLADLITFGITPFLTLFLLMKDDHPQASMCSILIVVCGAWRLAKFNLDTRQTTTFMGIPTPANALFFTSLPFFLNYFELTLSPWVAVLLVIVFSLLMISDIPMLSLKVSNWTFSENWQRLIFIGISLITLGFFHLAGVSIVILLYIVLSTTSFLLIRSTR